jgi:hypothetical protein
MNATTPERLDALQGRAVLGTYGTGSKSEREAVFLETSTERYILRRKTGPVFGDVELEQYVGRQIECDGFVVGTTFLAERIQIID